MPELQTFRTACQGGLDVTSSVLTMADTKPGGAISLLNYESSLYGGYRKLSGYNHEYGTVPGVGPALGVLVKDGVNDGVFACRKPSSGSNYLYKWVDSSLSWDAIPSAGSPTMTGVEKVRMLGFNALTSTKFIMTDGINPAATYDGTTYLQLNGAGTPAKPKLAAWYAKHMVLSGDAANPNTLFISAPDNEADYSSANGGATFTVSFEVKALKAFRDSLFIFGTNSISKLTGNFEGNWAISEVTDNLGCIAENSIIELGGDLLFLGPDGIRPISATDKIGDVELETLSRPIQAITSSLISSTNLSGIRSVIIRAKSQFRYFYTDLSESYLHDPILITTAMGGAGTIVLNSSVDFPIAGTIIINDEEFSYTNKDTDKRTLTGVSRAVGDTVNAAHSVKAYVRTTTATLDDPTGIIGSIRDTGWEFGRLGGIQAHCAHSGYLGNEEFVLHGDTSGLVFRQEVGSTFGTVNISSIFQTPYFDFGDPELRKTMYKISTYVRAEGDLAMNMSLIYDYDNVATLNSENYTVGTTGQGTIFSDIADIDTSFTYDAAGAIYETSNPSVEQAVSGSGKSVSIRFVTNDANPSHSIQGFALLFNMEER